MKTLNRKLLLAGAITLALGSSNLLADDKMAMKDHSGPIVNARQEAQIWTTYALSPHLRATDISVAVLDGKATLTGSVADDVQKDLAGAIASGVGGVKDVDNQIKVDADYKKPEHTGSRGYGGAVDDATITAAVKSKLLWSKHTEGMETKVETKDGKVELSGTVGSQQAKQQAEKLAKNTNGVRAVDNKLQISDKPAKGKSANKEDKEKGTVIADSWITTKVKSTFMYSSNVAGSDISVNTDNGIVTLSGKVDSGAEQALAIELAQNIRGVKSVSSKQLIF
ncbi:BON domain-containing protein [Arsukibacterium sp.]|uniref:BON domain-containing protein n=1 Tax=Arsukibacterium sp. TaxID=1977258 RepID=UPI003563B7B3